MPDHRLHELTYAEIASIIRDTETVSDAWQTVARRWCRSALAEHFGDDVTDDQIDRSLQAEYDAVVRERETNA